MRRSRKEKEKEKNSNDKCNDVLKVKGIKMSYYIKMFNYIRRDKYYYDYALFNKFKIGMIYNVHQYI